MKALVDIIGAIHHGLDEAGLGSVADFVTEYAKGSPEEAAAANAILDNLRDTLRELADGAITADDAEFVVQEAKHGLLALAEAKAVRIQVATVDAFFSVLFALLPAL